MRQIINQINKQQHKLDRAALCILCFTFNALFLSLNDKLPTSNDDITPKTLKQLLEPNHRKQLMW